MKTGKLRTFWIWTLALLAGVLCTILIAAEVVLRRAGMKPYEVPEIPQPRVEPGGKLFQKHPELGYTNRPGRYRLTYPTGLQVTYTNLPDHRRITRPLSEYPSERFAAKPEVWFFGASFTYGDSLSDEQTFPYLLQKRFPEHELLNFAVNGYSNLNSLLQYRAALESREVPALVVLFYASFHMQRNTGMRRWQKILVPGDSLGIKTLPRAALNDDGTLAIWAEPVGYTEFPLIRSSVLVHFLELAYNEIEFQYSDSRQVTERIIEEMAALSRANDVSFLVVTIQSSPVMKKNLERLKIPVRDIGLDPNNPAYTNLPHDPHPSPLANREYALRLEAIFRTHLK